MLRRCVPRRKYTIHSPRAVPFEYSAADARELATAKYKSRWMFGAKTDFMDMSPAVAEFVPFFLCRGTVSASYRATVGYRTLASDGKTWTTRSVTTAAQHISSSFHENYTQLYGGYKYNNRHIQAALRNPANAVKMRKISQVDVTVGQIGLFEMSTNTMRTLLAEEVKQQVKREAEAQVRSFHPTAESVSVNFTEFSMNLQDVYPTFLPCYVIKAAYDGQEYTLYVSGSEGVVGGPYLLNALYVARAAALQTLALVMLLSANKASAFLYGSVASVAVYFVAFYAAKYFPTWRRDYFRRQREAERKRNESADESGFKPSRESTRITEEYHRSTYWDTHEYQKKKEGNKTSQQQNEASSSSAGGASSSDSSRSSSSRATGKSSRYGKDPQGYYAILQVECDASVNDIRSAYRQRVLMDHPDAGGSTEKMTKLNEAYRVLRDPQLRELYDKS